MWYRVDAPADFAVKRGQGIIELGHAEVVKLSQHELVLQAETRIPAGTEISIDVPWPGCERMLVLRLTGRAVRNERSQVTVRFGEYKFQIPGRLSRKVPEASAKRSQARLISDTPIVS